MPTVLSPVEGVERERFGPLQIALGYVLFAGAWIVFSDRLLAMFFPDPKFQALLQTVKGGAFVLVTGLLLFWVLRRHFARIVEGDQVLQEIFAAVGVATGQAFFQSLVEHLARTLRCGFAFVGEVDEERKRVNIVAIQVHGAPGESFSYDLAGTPCAEVLGGRLCFHPDHAADRFPDDALLREMGIESYLGVPLLNEHGRAIGLLVVMDDAPFRATERVKGVFRLFAERAATELLRRRAERALQAQFSQLATIFDAINAVVYVADMESGRLLYLNHFGERLFGEDWQGKNCFEVLQENRETFCPFCTNPDLVRDGVPQPPCVWEFQNTRTGRWYQCTDRAIRWTDGRLVRLEVAVDITEQKEMERMKDEMVSAVSHEMRTPLTVMLGYVEFLLEQEADPGRQREFLRVVQQQAERLDGLIGNFLDFQRMRTRKSAVSLVPVDLAALLQEAASLFAYSPGDHPLSVGVPEGMPRIRGNPEQLRLVVDNLLSNAFKYSPPGGQVFIGARTEPEAVIFWVKDEGIGIPRAELEKIFETFYRVDNTDTRPVGGTGLGLALVKEVVRLHGGRVWVDSREGEGSTFFVRLPLDPQTCSGASVEAEPPPGGGRVT